MDAIFCERFRRRLVRLQPRIVEEHSLRRFPAGSVSRCFMIKSNHNKQHSFMHAGVLLLKKDAGGHLSRFPMVQGEESVMDNPKEIRASETGLSHYLSPVAAWALSFGCAVGWGAFVMPGTTFLPIAGPIGTTVGMLIGSLVMLVIGWNYIAMMKKYPDAGGTFSYAKHIFGYDHGFFSAWFLALTYIAILWANATALSLIVRNLLGGVFQFGFHYSIAFGSARFCCPTPPSCFSARWLSAANGWPRTRRRCSRFSCWAEFSSFSARR